MKKISLLIFMLTMVVVAAVAQPQGMRRMMMMPDYRNPDSTATVVAKEMKLSEELEVKFTRLYATYLNEYKKIDEMLPVQMPRERGQRPSPEQMQQMREIMEARETVTTEMRKVYDEKFTELLGDEKFSVLKTVEKKQAEKRMQEMMKRFNRQGGHRGGRFGGFGGGNFQGGGGFGGGNFQGGGFPGGDDSDGE